MSIFGRQPGQARYNGELNNLQLTQSVYATAVPIVIGTARVPPKLIFYGGFKATQAPSSGKGLGGGKNEQFDYYADILILLAQASQTQTPAGILNIWDQNGKLENLSGSFSYTIPGGGGSVQPTAGNPVIQQDFGVTKAVAYSVTANDYGAGASQTLTGTQQVAMTPVSGTPAAGQYNFNATTSTYTFAAADAGKTVSIQYSSVFSLYYFEETQAAQIPLVSPYRVSTNNESYFQADQGVIFVSPTGNTAGAFVGGTPTASGQYSVSAGVYIFYSGDAGKYVYINYEYYSSDPDLTNSSSQNITFFNGAQSQAPWSYMVSKYPGSALGYSTLCYAGMNPAFLGESATLPGYNYELVSLCRVPGQLDADPTQAIALLLTDAFCGCSFPSANLGSLTLAQAYWLSNGFVVAQNLTSAGSVSETIGRWLEAGQVAAIWSEGLLKFIPYGDATTVGNGYTYTPQTTPVVTLTYDDILPWQGKGPGESTKDDPIQSQRKQPQDRFNYVQVQWTNRLNDYNNELTIAQNDAFIAQYRLRLEPAQTWDFLTTQAAASWALQLRLNRNLYIPETGKFYLPFTFSYIEPMDVVVLPTGEAVRVTSVDEDEEGKLEIGFENFDYGSCDVSTYTKQAVTSYQPNVSQSNPGNAVPVFIQNTTVQANGILNKLQIAASGQNPNWGGCNVYVSRDGVTYSELGVLNSPAVIGLLSANLGSNVDPDTTDTLSVDITLSQLGNEAAELVSVTQANADNFITLCAIVDQSGLTNELISYESAALVAQGQYNLTYLRRGIYSTVTAAHTAGAFFAFLGPSYKFLDYQYSPQYVGQLLYVKLQSFNLAGNQLQNLSQCTVWELFVTQQGISYQPLYKPSTNTVTNLSSGTGSASVTNPTYGYDGNLTTPAVLQALGGGTGQGEIEIVYSGFGTGVTITPLTLYIYIAYALEVALADSCEVQVAITGGTATIRNYQPSSYQPPPGETITFTIPVGQNLATLAVNIGVASTATAPEATVSVFEVWIQ